MLSLQDPVPLFVWVNNIVAKVLSSVFSPSSQKVFTKYGEARLKNQILILQMGKQKHTEVKCLLKFTLKV